MLKKMKNKNRYQFLAMYTLLFLITAGVVYALLFTHGLSFIWQKDGWTQHFRALRFYSNWLQDIARSLISKHSLVMPNWSFCIGYGSDIITALHYYVIGDPLNLLSVFVPDAYMVYFYDGLFLLRLYLAGLAFSYYCFCMGHKNKVSVITGAMIYISCGYVLMMAAKHPFFITPVIYLPLILAGVEKLLRKGSPCLFTGAVVLSAVSNFYFFYMVVLLTVIYVVFRIFMLYDIRHVREALRSIADLTKYAVSALCMSAFLLLPVAMLFLKGHRTDDTPQTALFLGKEYFFMILKGFINYGHTWQHTYFVYSFLVLLALLTLFMMKKRGLGLKIAFLLLTLFFMMPIAGKIFNGFGYVSNRWGFGYSLLLSYIVIYTWDELISLEKKKLMASVVFVVVLAGISCLDGVQKNKNLLISLILALLTLTIIGLGRYLPEINGKKVSELAVMCLVIVSLGVNSFFSFQSKEKVGLKWMTPIESVRAGVRPEPDQAVKEAAKAEGETDFFRYAGNWDVIERNSTLQSGLFSTSFYWSLENGEIDNYFRKIGLNVESCYKFRELDERTILNELAGVKYYVTSKKNEQKVQVPYGYEKVMEYAQKAGGSKMTYIVYKNKNALPLAYAYKQYLTKEEWLEFDLAGREESLMQAVVLNEGQKGYENARLGLDSQKMDYNIVCGGGVKKEDSSFVVNKKGGKVTLSFGGLENSETYLVFKGLKFEPPVSKNRNKAKLYVHDETDSVVSWEKTIRLMSSENPKYEYREDYIANLGYGKKRKTGITIRFEKKGTYHIEELSVVCKPMDRYEEQVNALKEDVLEHIDIGTDCIKGDISLDESKILCFSIPYSSGWKAYVDGKEEKLIPANIMYMALPLASGDHKIELRYRTPGLYEGAAVSLAGLVLFVVLLMLDKRKKKHNRAFCP